MSDSNFMRVGFAGMQQAQTDLAAAHNQIVSALEDLQSQAQNMLHQWTGTARDAYYVDKAKWDAAANDMSNVLAAANRHMINTTDNYMSTENANTNIWA